jgi:hypothetical protein
VASGRPTKYKDEYAEQVKKLCDLGATDRQLADFFKVAESTINLWKLEHPEFSESLKLGKEVPNNNVERSLYNRALGYSHETEDIRVIENEIVITSIIKHYPPDSTAAIFFLKNRKPKDYKDKHDVVIDNTDLVKAFTDLSVSLPK